MTFRKLTVLVLMAMLASMHAVTQCPVAHVQDASPYINAKTAIAKRALKQAQARLETCEKQPKSKRALCAEWADSANKAADDIEVMAFAEIDKLMAAR
jgi:hypothetical protein